MASILDKIKLKTGVDSRSNHNLSCYHATTARQYEPRITYFHEFVPSERWNMDARCSVRTLPLVRPAIADIKVHNRFFFVPYYSIMETWNNFLADTPVANTSGQEIPKITIFYESSIKSVLSNPSYGYSEVANSTDYDFCYISGSATTYRSFTAKGKVAYSILLGLGYNIDLSLPSGVNGLTFNALPLLAYLKVWLDWYNNTAFDTTNDLYQYFRLSNSSRTLTIVALSQILDSVTHTYLEKDYFTSATLNPMAPNSTSLESSISVPDVSMGSIANRQTTILNTGSTSTPYINAVGQADESGSSYSFTRVSKYAIEAVQSLTDYVKRHQLAGIQPFNRILAEYGVALTDEELRRSTFIGDVVEDIDISTVVSNSYNMDENNPSILGERAGMANGGQQKHLNFSNDNFGCIICVTTIVPRSSYTDGVKKHCLRVDRFDFFTPEVEHLGVEPIQYCELQNGYAEPDGSLAQRPAKNRIFGYLPRYAAYKTALDTLSGDFCVRSVKEQYEPWIMRRVVPPYVESQSISLDFCTAKFNTNNSVFVEPDADNYILFNMYHVKANLPMHALYDDYQWSNEDDNPRTVTLHNQGIQKT